MERREKSSNVVNHASDHYSLKLTTESILNNLVDGGYTDGRRIEIYDEGEPFVRTFGNNTNKEPIKLMSFGSEGDELDEYFTILDDEKIFRLHDPSSSWYEIITGKSITGDREEFHRKFYAQIDTVTTKMCVELASKCKDKDLHTGTLSKADYYVILHYALKSDKVQEGMEIVSRFNPRTNAGKKFQLQVINIRAEELDLPRNIWAGKWIEGKLVEIWKAEDWRMILKPGKRNKAHATVRRTSTSVNLASQLLACHE